MTFLAVFSPEVSECKALSLKCILLEAKENQK